jgi:hypothetical protein
MTPPLGLRTRTSARLQLAVSVGLGCFGAACSSGATRDGSIPTKDGVPIGDCVEPTPAELAALGCPATAFQQGSSCDRAAALRCRFAISARNGYASQDVLQCAASNSPTSPGAMEWLGARVTCGRTCQLPATNAIALVTADCEGRAVVSCRGDLEAQGQVFSAESTAQDLLDAELAAAVFACAKGGVFNQFVEVSVANGCPRTLAVPTGFDPALAACVKARLESARWDCAVPLACGAYQRIFI